MKKFILFIFAILPLMAIEYKTVQLNKCTLTTYKIPNQICIKIKGR